MNVLAVDIGGTNVKILATGATVPRRFPSGPPMTPAEMVRQVRALAADWEYEAVSLGYPGPIASGRIVENRKTSHPVGSALTSKANFAIP